MDPKNIDTEHLRYIAGLWADALFQTKVLLLRGDPAATRAALETELKKMLGAPAAETIIGITKTWGAPDV